MIASKVGRGVSELHWAKNRLARICAVFVWLSFGVVASSQVGGGASHMRNLVGHPAPGFTVTTLSGKPVSLVDYRGKAVLVNFWATWCGNCKLEMPWLAELREQYAPQGFEVLGILTNDAPPEEIATITQRYGVKYPILMCNHKAAQAYGGLAELPESFFIDRHGRVVTEMTGADSKAAIEADIRKALLH
jgi:peroxiredoxin